MRRRQGPLNRTHRLPGALRLRFCEMNYYRRQFRTVMVGDTKSRTIRNPDAGCDRTCGSAHSHQWSSIGPDVHLNFRIAGRSPEKRRLS